MTASAALSLASSITSVRTTPICISTRSAFAGPNAWSPDRRYAARAKGGRLLGRCGRVSHQHSNWRRYSDQPSGASCVVRRRAVFRSDAPLLCLVHKADVVWRTTDTLPSKSLDIQETKPAMDEAVLVSSYVSHKRVPGDQLSALFRQSTGHCRQLRLQPPPQWPRWSRRSR